MESALRRKYTLIDKNDFAAISAVQKVSGCLLLAAFSRIVDPRPFRGSRCLARKPIGAGAEGSRWDACLWFTAVSRTGDQGIPGAGLGTG